MRAFEHIILPLDVPSVEQAIELVALLKNDVGAFKVGLELANSSNTATSADTLSRLKQAGAKKIFFDAKLHDIPNTVAGAMRGIVRNGVWCVTVHTMGGSAMLRAAVEAARSEAARLGVSAPLVFGVTVLTSISEVELRQELLVTEPMVAYTARLARLAHAAGCSGVIASPSDTAAIRAAIPDPLFLIVTPGVRPAGSDRGDQARVSTPAEAIAAGSNYLVIGRPIYAAADPVAAANNISAEIESANSLV